MNKERREKFIQPLSDGVKKSYITLWKKIDIYEKEIGKEFENFTVDDFNKFVKTKLIKGSAKSTNVKVSLLKRYTEHIGCDFIQLDYEAVRNMVDDCLKEKRIEDENELRYVSMDELSIATNRLTNDIDVAIVYLLRYGISGKRFTELINLKTKDIDFENKVIKLKNRKVEIDDGMCEILKYAIKQSEYYVIKDLDKEIPKAESYELNMNSDYLIKPKPRSDNDFGLSSYKDNGLIGRLFRIMQELGIGISSINLLQSHATDEIIKYEEELGREISTKECSDYLRKIGSRQSGEDIISMKKWLKKKYKE